MKFLNLTLLTILFSSSAFADFSHDRIVCDRSPYKITIDRSTMSIRVSDSSGETAALSIHDINHVGNTPGSFSVQGQADFNGFEGLASLVIFYNSNGEPQELLYRVDYSPHKAPSNEAHIPCRKL